jgi:hypothetical protein|tara:strand:+ start:90 stop:341 length:252 start_codon:yes stop_codon:yes gene_type:complete
MKFKLVQLYTMNESKPLVGVDDVEVQWDTCDLSECPPERVPGTVSMVNHGKLSQCADEDLPKVFTDTNGTEHRIEDIHSLRSS